MKCKWIKKLTAGIIFLAAVGSLSGCQKAATSENLFRDIEVNMTSVESAEENQIVKLQMGDGDSAISQESNLDIEMTRNPAAVHRKGQQKTNMAGTKETQEMESYQVEEDGKTVIYLHRMKPGSRYPIFLNMDLIMVLTVLPCRRLQHGIII